MSTSAALPFPTDAVGPIDHPVRVHLEPETGERNRLTTAFRIFLAIPHLILVGGPVGLALSWTDGPNRLAPNWGIGGALGVVAAACALLSWFALVFTGRAPKGLSSLTQLYLRWRVRAVAYTALLRDEYPPFQDEPYPAWLEMAPPAEPRNRVTVAFRILLAIPHVVAVWALGVAWALATVVAWFAILFTGRYPRGLYGFATGVFRWSTRVEAYCLLLTDVYPPFALD